MKTKRKIDVLFVFCLDPRSQSGMTVIARMHTLRTPVLLIAFNRPDLTQRVFAAIREARPERFFFFVDAPRTREEAVKVNDVKALVQHIDWQCDLDAFFPEKNLGHTYGPIAAMNRIFNASEEAIIFEDDCLPHPTFFRYCEEMLAQYRDEPKVWSIAGANYLNPNPHHPYSCWFSPLTSTWGWASWRRSWRKVDFTLSQWPALRNTPWLARAIGDTVIAADYAGGFNKSFANAGKPNFVGWDYCYNFAMLVDGALDARPAVNLVSNIGFRLDASHTKEKTSYADFPVHEMKFPLRFPPRIEPRTDLEVLFYRQHTRQYHPWRHMIKALPAAARFLTEGKQYARMAYKSLHRAGETFERITTLASLTTDYRFRAADFLVHLIEPLARGSVTIEEIVRHDTTDLLRIGNLQFHWPHGTSRKGLAGIWREVFHHPWHNPHAYEYKSVRIHPGDTVIDAGCCEGFFTQYARTRHAQNVVAIEPVEALVTCLQKTFEKEIRAKRVSLVKALLGNANALSSVYVHADTLYESGQRENGVAQPVQMLTLDALTKRLSLNKIDFIKMDIEGGEVHAIEGARETLRRFRPRLAIAVYHTYDNAQKIRNMILSINPDYSVAFRGIYNHGGVNPRPYMLFAY